MSFNRGISKTLNIKKITKNKPVIGQSELNIHTIEVEKMSVSAITPTQVLDISIGKGLLKMMLDQKLITRREYENSIKEFISQINTINQGN